jgi:hypothetical protein
VASRGHPAGPGARGDWERAHVRTDLVTQDASGGPVRALPVARGAALPRWLAGREGRRWILRALAVIGVVAGLLYTRKHGDFAGYILVGTLVLEDRHIYFDAPPGVNTWPPLFSVLCVPFALLALVTPYLPRSLWVALNVVLLLVVLDLIARLVYGRRLTLDTDSPGLSLASAEILIPLLLTSRYVLSNFEHLQVSLVLFALTLGGLYLAPRRAAWAGVLLGLAAAIKVWPIAVVAYLGYRRRWRAALWATVAAAAFSASPALVFGWSRFRGYVAAWGAILAEGWPVGPPNQSVFAMWDRFVGHGLAPLAGSIDRLPPSRDPVVAVAVAATLAAVAPWALVAFRDRPGRDDWRALAEWSVVLIVATLFGPVAWKHYLVVLLLPTTLLFAVWRAAPLPARTRRVAGGVLLASFLIGGATGAGMIGFEPADTLGMSSAITVATLVLLGGVLWLRSRLPAGLPDRAGEGVPAAGPAPVPRPLDSG